MSGEDERRRREAQAKLEREAGRPLLESRPAVSDARTGSTLRYHVFDAGKEGGYVLRYDFRAAPGERAFPCRVLLRDVTSFEAAEWRRQHRQPEPESSDYLATIRWSVEHGRSLHVVELDFLRDNPCAMGRATGLADCWLIDLHSIEKLGQGRFVSTLARLIYGWASERPEGGYYPDRLTIQPYRMGLLYRGEAGQDVRDDPDYA